MSDSNLLVVESLCLSSVVSRGLSDLKNISKFSSGINTGFLPTQQDLINSLSPDQNINNLSVNLNLSNVSTIPIRTITKYLNNLLLITRRK